MSQPARFAGMKHPGILLTLLCLLAPAITPLHGADAGPKSAGEQAGTGVRMAVKADWKSGKLMATRLANSVKSYNSGQTRTAPDKELAAGMKVSLPGVDTSEILHMKRR